MEYREQLERFVPQDEVEQAAKRALTALVWSQGDTLLTREAHAHLTAAALIVTPALDRVLFVHHNLFGTFTWPGGHADGERDLLAVAAREAREETGAEALCPVSGGMLALRELSVPTHEKNGVPVAAHRHFMAVYGFLAPREQTLRVCPGENSAVEWLPADALSTYCAEAHMLPVYEACLLRLRRLLAEKEALPARLPALLLPWYAEHARELPWRADKDPYHVWLSEIMLQQTRVEAVKGYYARFLQALPTVEALSRADEETVNKLWEGLGYYSRARNLRRAAQAVMKEHGGVFPKTYEALLRLPGVGAYTAGAVASICFEEPVAAVDGNVLRVLARLREDYRSVNAPAVREEAAAVLGAVYPRGKCGDFTQGLMELGAMVCLPNGAPRCDACPLAAVCLARRCGTAASLPVRDKRKPRRVEERTVYVLQCGGRVAVRRRGARGLLAGLWELPNTPGKSTEDGAVAQAAHWGAAPEALLEARERVHVFTHVEWHMVCYFLRCGTACEEFVWADPDELAGRYALPTAFRLFLCNEDYCGAEQDVL